MSDTAQGTPCCIVCDDVLETAYGHAHEDLWEDEEAGIDFGCDALTRVELYRQDGKALANENTHMCLPCQLNEAREPDGTWTTEEKAKVLGRELVPPAFYKRYLIVYAMNASDGARRVICGGDALLSFLSELKRNDLGKEEEDWLFLPAAHYHGSWKHAADISHWLDGRKPFKPAQGGTSESHELHGLLKQAERVTAFLKLLLQSRTEGVQEDPNRHFYLAIEGKSVQRLELPSEAELSTQDCQSLQKKWRSSRREEPPKVYRDLVGKHLPDETAGALGVKMLYIPQLRGSTLEADEAMPMPLNRLLELQLWARVPLRSQCWKLTGLQPREVMADFLCNLERTAGLRRLLCCNVPRAYLCTEAYLKERVTEAEQALAKAHENLKCALTYQGRRFPEDYRADEPDGLACMENVHLSSFITRNDQHDDDNDDPYVVFRYPKGVHCAPLTNRQRRCKELQEEEQEGDEATSSEEDASDLEAGNHEDGEADSMEEEEEESSSEEEADAVASESEEEEGHGAEGEEEEDEENGGTQAKANGKRKKGASKADGGGDDSKRKQKQQRKA